MGSEHKALKLVECSGSPREMGRQYGEQAREEIQRDLELRSRRWNRDTMDVLCAHIKASLQSSASDVLDELEGLAESAGVDVRHVLLANHVDTFGAHVERCTPIILRESPEGVIVAKNNDAPMPEDYPFIIRKGIPAKGIPFLQVTYAGWLSGLDMMNAEGLANTHGSVGSVFDKTGKRIDIRLYAYHLMQTCKTTEAFIQKLMRVPLTGKGLNIAVGDAQGMTAMLDAAVPLVAIRNRNRQFDYATNIYLSEGLENADMRSPEKRHICVHRHGYLRWLEHTAPPRNLGDIKKLLSSHEPWAPCRHGGPHGSRTVWSMICLPGSRTALVSHGSPCQNAYKEYAL